MTHSEALSILKEISAKPVFMKALSHLKPKTELALVLDERVEFALFKNENGVDVEERVAIADVEFRFTSEAARQLSQNEGDQLATFGIAVLEQVLAGQMKIRVRGSLWNVITGGYVQMVLAGGPEFLAFLAQHGLTNSKKIIDLMRSLKS